MPKSARRRKPTRGYRSSMISRTKAATTSCSSRYKRNYDQIKADAQVIINEEMERIKSDPELCERLGLKTKDEKADEEDKEN